MKGCNCVGCKATEQKKFYCFWEKNAKPRTRQGMILDFKQNIFLFALFAVAGLCFAFLQLGLCVSCWSVAIIFFISALFDKKLFLERYD